MNVKQFLAKIAELLLESDEGTKDWLSVQTLRRTWYTVCGISLAILILNFMEAPFGAILAKSEGVTLCFRIIFLALFVLLQITICLLSFRYYVYVLSQKASIRIDNVLSFYAMSSVIFAQIYRCSYKLSQELFTYTSPPIEIQTVVTKGDYWGNMQMFGDFLLFSLFQTVNSSFYKIHANSVFVSIITYFQSLFTFALVTLLVASYVNQKTK